MKAKLPLYEWVTRVCKFACFMIAPQEAARRAPRGAPVSSFLKLLQGNGTTDNRPRPCAACLRCCVRVPVQA